MADFKQVEILLVEDNPTDAELTVTIVTGVALISLLQVFRLRCLLLVAYTGLPVGRPIVRQVLSIVMDQFDDTVHGQNVILRGVRRRDHFGMCNLIA